MLAVKARVGKLLPKGCLKNWAQEGRVFQGENQEGKSGGTWEQPEVQLGRITAARGMTGPAREQRRRGSEGLLPCQASWERGLAGSLKGFTVKYWGLRAMGETGWRFGGQA